jgi:hypothetical protein
MNAYNSAPETRRLALAIAPAGRDVLDNPTCTVLCIPATCPPGRDGHRAVRPPEPTYGRRTRNRRPAAGSAERNDYHAAHTLQLQMLQMGQLMTQFPQTQQQNWDMGSRNGMGMPSLQNMQHM